MAVWLAVASGSALGGVLRHGLNHVIHQRNVASTFPMGIFTINVIGSFVIGAIAGALASGRLHLGYEARTFLIVGVLGGFTTFSAFSLEIALLIEKGMIGLAAAYAATSIVAGAVGLFAGLAIMRGAA